MHNFIVKYYTQGKNGQNSTQEQTEMARDFLPISHPVYHLVYVGKMVDLLHVNCSANFVNRAVRSSVDVEVTNYKKN